MYQYLCWYMIWSLQIIPCFPKITTISNLHSKAKVAMESFRNFSAPLQPYFYISFLTDCIAFPLLFSLVADCCWRTVFGFHEDLKSLSQILWRRFHLLLKLAGVVNYYEDMPMHWHDFKLIKVKGKSVVNQYIAYLFHVTGMTPHPFAFLPYTMVSHFFFLG